MKRENLDKAKLIEAKIIQIEEAIEDITLMRAQPTIKEVAIIDNYKNRFELPCFTDQAFEFIDQQIRDYEYKKAQLLQEMDQL